MLMAAHLAAAVGVSFDPAVALLVQGGRDVAKCDWYNAPMGNLRNIAKKLNGIDDPYVADFSGVIARLYNAEKVVAEGLLSAGGESPEGHPMIRACVTRLRDRLTALLVWHEGRA